MEITTFITEYSGDVPNRAGDTPIVFAENVYSYQIWIDQNFVPNYNQSISEVNQKINEIKTYSEGVFNQAVDGGYSQEYINENFPSKSQTYLKEEVYSKLETYSKEEVFTKEESKALIAKEASNPLTTTNPTNIGDIWVNSQSGEIFTCTDNTTDTNVWEGTNGTTVPAPATASVFGRIWNITDDVYKRIGLDFADFGVATKLEFENWLSPTAERVNDNDVFTPSDLTKELDTNTNLPFNSIKRKVVSNLGLVTDFDHVTAPSATEQIMTEIPKCYYVDVTVVSGGKEYDVKLTSINPFSVDAIEDLGFLSVESITAWNPTTGISSGTISGNVISSVLHPAFVWHDGSEADFTYVGSFWSVSGRSTFGSGIRATANITLPTARTQNKAFGTNFNQHDIWNNALIQLLAYIERGSNYLEQSGTKWDGYSWNSGAGSYNQDNGLTISLENKTGVILDGSSRVIANSYRGIENYHSGLWVWVDGININSGVCHLAKAGSVFASDTDAAPYFSSGYTTTTTASWRNINKWQPGTFIPDNTSGGTTSSKVSDQMYGTTGWRVLRFGGGLANPGLSGLSTWRGGDASSNSNWGIVSRASFRKFL